MVTPSYPRRQGFMIPRVSVPIEGARRAGPAFCNASTDSTFVFMAECGRWAGHDGSHYDFDHDVEWDANGPVEV